MRTGLAILSLLLTVPTIALAGAEAPLQLPIWSSLPFVLLLLAISFLPVLCGHFWHRNLNKAMVTALLALPVAGYLFFSDAAASQGRHLLSHALAEYGSFIVLLGSLYTVSGGIILRGDIQGKPLTNTGFLALGAILANLIGTTGASMLLIRPILRINQERQRVAHLPIFFIFTVSNLGGLLTPLGDPPLFLGFLRGVDFFWTLTLWKEWLVVNGLVLAVFLVWDSVAYTRETQYAIRQDVVRIEPIRVHGLVNLLFLSGILVAVVFQSEAVTGGRFVLHKPWGEAIMIAMALLSLFFTPAPVRRDNLYSWHPIVEVAVIFAGIFVTMAPALELVKAYSPQFGLDKPWHYFWLTGVLSSFLDNAPTYLVFATIANRGDDFSWLAANEPLILAAISCGAVFMGANTYIGNGPNFMVKAISDQAGVRMPSFFGYMLYSGLILLPIFVLVTLVFFY